MNVARPPVSNEDSQLELRMDHTRYHRHLHRTFRFSTVRRLLYRSIWLGAFVALAALKVGAGEPPTVARSSPRPDSARANVPWSRIVMVAASATAGFTESEPLGGTATSQFRLSRYLDAAVAVPHEPVKNLATAMFFLQPE